MLGEPHRWNRHKIQPASHRSIFNGKLLGAQRQAARSTPGRPGHRGLDSSRGEQDPCDGPTRRESRVHGPIVDIISELDEEVDLVLSGHTHQFTNALVRNQSGKVILVTQVYSYGTAYPEINLGTRRWNP